MAHSSHPAIPVGTQVVTLVEVRGPGGLVYPLNAVGVVVDSHPGPKMRYTVRFPDGGDAELGQDDLVARKHFQRQVSSLSALSPACGDEALYEYVIYRCVVGSTA